LACLQELLRRYRAEAQVAELAHVTLALMKPRNRGDPKIEPPPSWHCAIAGLGIQVFCLYFSGVSAFFPLHQPVVCIFMVLFLGPLLKSSD